MIINEDIFDDVHDENTDKNKIVNEFNEENEHKMEDHLHSDESKISVNCNLKVNFDTKNKMIYLYPGKSQYFTVDVLRCCGDVTIKYNGRYQSKGICGNLGIYSIVQSGIIVETYCKLDSKKNDILNFTAIDECTKECCDFVVIFGCNTCGCCY